MCTYKAPHNRILIFADDFTPRWTSSFAMVDYDTAAIGDKFGNIAVVRCEQSRSEITDEDPTGAAVAAEKPYLQGSSSKFKLLAHYNLGDIPTSMHRTSMVPGGKDVVLWTGIEGSIGIVSALLTKTDVEFMQALEKQMRTEAPSVVSRSHMAYRGYYAPVKSVIDGELCEAFASLSGKKQLEVAEAHERTTGEVLKKLEQLRVTASGF